MINDESIFSLVTSLDPAVDPLWRYVQTILDFLLLRKIAAQIAKEGRPCLVYTTKFLKGESFFSPLLSFDLPRSDMCHSMMCAKACS